jgi:hypothetical protein
MYYNIVYQHAPLMHGLHYIATPGVHVNTVIVIHITWSCTEGPPSFWTCNTAMTHATAYPADNRRSACQSSFESGGWEISLQTRSSYRHLINAHCSVASLMICISDAWTKTTIPRNDHTIWDYNVIWCGIFTVHYCTIHRPQAATGSFTLLQIMRTSTSTFAHDEIMKDNQ